ncbi:MAG: sigma 54-interacting transcriptional regulator [Gemmatimonadales bacterium]|nr:sigma 54-interacting transcriptional regulator [Gemmatimonadales bacterium]
MTTALPFSPVATASQVEPLLDRLPVGVFRLALARLPRTADPSILIAELLERAEVVYANAALAAFEGTTAAALTGVPFGRLLAGAVLRRGNGGAEFVRNGLRLEAAELRIARKGERTRSFEVSLHGITDGPEVTGVWGAMVDLTPTVDTTDPNAAADRDHTIVGSGAAITRLLEKVGQVAATDATVMITGETGTGKELVARAIHERSARAGRPLVAVNCGALSPTLIETELFGHEKGAFTGAADRKLGRFEVADGGTLFLDEIGDLSLDLQVRLLRVLQEGELFRVGGTDPIRVDVRVIAATHRDLPAAVRAGTFRQDLYYRLNVFPIKTPPLRERREDIPALVRHFTARAASRLGKRIDVVPPAVLEAFGSYPWPGNIRELANVVERSVIVTTGSILQLGEWATGQYQPVVVPAMGSRTLEEMEREHIVRALERCRWKVSGPGGAAEALNLKPTTLEARMKKLNIVRPG